MGISSRKHIANILSIEKYSSTSGTYRMNMCAFRMFALCLDMSQYSVLTGRGTTGPMAIFDAIFGSEDRRWGGSSIFGVEERRWGWFFEDGGFFEEEGILRRRSPTIPRRSRRSAGTRRRRAYFNVEMNNII